MILLSVEINCLRGIKNLKLDFNGKNSVIYGDNGTGKSGVIDAIDFLIKGEITRLSGIGSKNLSLDKHGKYVTESIDNSWVKAVVKLPDYDESIEIMRYLKDPNKLVCDPKYSAEFEEIGKLAELRAHYLSRREILQVINSTDQDRAKNIEKLLNLYSLDKNRAALQKAKKSLEDELKSGQSQERAYIDKISEKLGVEQSDWLDAVNDIRVQLGANPLTVLGPDVITTDLSLTKTATPKAEVASLIQKVEDVYKSFCCGSNNLINVITETKLIYEKKLLSQKFDEEIDYITLYEHGRKLLKSDICPLCEQKIEDKDKLSSKLQDKICKLTQTKKVLCEYQGAIKKLQENIASIKQQLSSINLKILSKYVDVENLKSIVDGVVNFYNAIENRF